LAGGGPFGGINLDIKSKAKTTIMKTKRAVATVRKAAGAAGASAAAQIHAWENDPFAQATPTNPPVQATPIARPVPNLGSTPLAIGISSPQPPPQVYNTGTPEFRYWAATEALGRGRDFWRGILPAGTNWHTTVGPKLIVNLDNGVDLNAYYDRHNLDFFHGSAGGMTVYSGESPDVVCHELGHATLDALKPALFNAGFIETAAFHESFGDMSALLSALQTTQMRHDVLAETHGHLARSSSLSRLAEQLGWAIRQSSPSAVDPDCLRNAANSLFYRNPSTLPPSAPASSLSSEPHSFSRVFTGAFLDALAGMLHVVARAHSRVLDEWKVSGRMAHWLAMGLAILQAERKPENSFIWFGTTSLPFATTPAWKAILSAKAVALARRNWSGCATPWRPTRTGVGSGWRVNSVSAGSGAPSKGD